MICTRCRGLMTREELRDWGGGKGNDWSSAFRCIPCGDIIDPVILKNRARGAGAATLRKKHTSRKKHTRFDARVIPGRTEKALRRHMLTGMAAT